MPGGFKNFLASDKGAERQRKAEIKSMKKSLECTGYLEKPNTEVTDLGSTKAAGCVGHAATMQGWRLKNEDAQVLEADEDRLLAGMYDGHGGDMAAKYLKDHLAEAMKGKKDTAEIQDTFAEVDSRMRKTGQDLGSTGATCNFVIVESDRILCANTGDCRAVLCRGTGAIALSKDHQPDDEGERERVEKAGLTVAKGRIDGMLNVSRAFGDFDFKDEARPASEQAVSPCCDVTSTPRSPSDSFILQACDGIWGVLTDEQACSFVSNLHPATSPQGIIAQLCQKCLTTEDPGGPGSDNMSVNLIFFDN